VFLSALGCFVVVINYKSTEAIESRSCNTCFQPGGGETDTFNDLVVVSSLITNFPSDLSMRRRILKMVQKRADSVVTALAVGALRKVDGFAPEDVEFVRSCLADDNPWVEAATIDLLAEIDSNVRDQFMERLKAMAAEPQSTDVEAALERFFEHISPTHDSKPKNHNLPRPSDRN
jgi:hypothetical protein